jgi:hypothetical protein
MLIILERIKTDYIWIAELEKKKINFVPSCSSYSSLPVFPGPSGPDQLMAAWKVSHEHTGRAAGTRTELL